MSVGIVYGLFVLSEMESKKKNGFIRQFPPGKTIPGNVLDLKFNSYYIAGARSNNIYFGNYTNPNHLVKSSFALADTQHLYYKMPNDTIKIFKGSFVKADSAFVYLMDGVLPAVWRAKGDEAQFGNTNYSIPFFMAAVPISASSYVFRSSDKDRQNILVKTRGDSMRPFSGILQKQIDGMFCTDGVLSYDAATARILYTYHYRNQFICMDTNLNVLYRGKTIDTISHAQIKVASNKAGNEITLATPPLMVNKKSCISGNWIFINSDLKANNEQRKVFDEFSVIDVYAAANGKYSFSFYLPRYAKQKMRDFRVFGKTLVAMHDRYVLTYQLNF